MSFRLVLFIVLAVYVAGIGMPLWLAVAKGRKSGKMLPKAASTVIALWGSVAIGLIPGIVGYVALTPHKIGALIFGLGITAVAFPIIWFVIFVGPFGAGLLSRQPGFVYPELKLPGLASQPAPSSTPEPHKEPAAPERPAS